MIRVIYRWRIDPATGADFAAWWHEATIRIRSAEPGAMGSTLLRSSDDEACVIGIARWRDTGHLTAFWERSDPLAFPGAVLQSREILEEVDHLTLETESSPRP
jgi:heme-degrading monooxygenase HmoA